MNNIPIVRDVCLVGGGHSHALLLRRWAMEPIAGVRLTLVSSNVQTPYSGMLPGLIAGHYSVDDIHIDLLRLCSWAQVRFVEDTVTSIDLDNRQVNFSDRPGVSFDVLSLDTGSTPDLSVTGAAEHVTPVKPVSEFHARWRALQQRLNESEGSGTSIGVVGSGAGGFELVTAMRHRLRETTASCYWFLRSDDAISGRPERVGSLAIAAAEAAGIDVVRQFDVVSVAPGKLTAADGRSVSLTEIIWCTAASGPSWPAAAGLDTDKRGFVSTNRYLQSTSHPFVFATGDIGTQVQTPSNKAGVFAVRQAPVLFENIRRYLLSEKLKVYVPQKDFLSLMATGPKHAIASRGPLVVQGSWVWRWKNHIDQTFMDQFRDLPVRRMGASLAKLPDALNELHKPDNSFASNGLPGSSVSNSTGRAAHVDTAAMRCRGCGAKVGSDVLQRVLNDLATQYPQRQTLAQWSPAGDTAVVDLPSVRLVQSVDQINAIVDDPYLLGRIAALHAISDVITLDATVHSAQVLATLPDASERVVERDLRLLMRGVMSALVEEKCALIGGHTTQGADMSVGFVINASMLPNEPDTSDIEPVVLHVQSGDALVLTKPLGIGTLFSGLMQTIARGDDVSAAIDSMLKSNRQSAEILRSHGSVAMTDVTGFGLLGHLQRLLQGLRIGNKDSAVSRDAMVPGVTIALEQVPLFSGALALSRQGCRSSLWQQNSVAFTDVSVDSACDVASISLLVDPQTSGGLLAVVPLAAATDCLQALHASGFGQASLVGQIETDSTVRVVP